MKMKTMDGEILKIERGVEVMKKKVLMIMNGNLTAIYFYFLPIYDLCSF